ncbi:UDP-glucose/GDP-mannose dehydrogenase family protein [Candidatus Pelagibacter sp.]|nr:UDP-glucose/GDP-mannose dehydrogenase family protein [Candidatus Pelagibacter sp.]
MRDSSCLTMIPSLIKKGAILNYYDPTGKKAELDKLNDITFSNNIKLAIQYADLIIIHTEWNDFKSINFKRDIKNKKFKIFDMRNIYSPAKMKLQKVKYFGLGR